MKAMFRRLWAHNHVKVAILVAPFLVILGWVGAEVYLERKREGHEARLGLQRESRFLEVTTGCALPEYPCRISSGDLLATMDSDGQVLRLSANQPITGLTIKYAQDGKESRALPVAVQESTGNWQARLVRLSGYRDDQPLWLRLAFESDGVLYYAELPLEANRLWSE